MGSSVGAAAAPQPVQLVNEFEIREASGAIDTLRADGADGRHVLDVTLIRSGKSKMGNIYPSDVLRESTQLFEGVAAFADHNNDDRRPERSVRDIVGYYKNVRHLAEGEGGRLAGELHLLPGTDWLWTLMQETQRHPSICGLSIDAYASCQESDEGRQVAEFRRVNSVDVVTRASAGGTIDHIIASERNQKMPATPVPAPTAPPPALTPLQEAHQRELAELREAQQATLRQFEEMKATHVAGQLLEQKLEESDLPELGRAQLKKRFKDRVFPEAELTEAIADTQAIFATVSEAGKITGMGGPAKDPFISIGLTEYEKVQAGIDALFDVYESDAARALPRISGLREAFLLATGSDIGSVGGADRPVRESLSEGLRSKVRAGRLTESEVLLREADVTTASFSYLLGTSMNKRLLKDYQAWPSEWQKFTTVTSLKDFKQQDRIRLGAFGSLSTVLEDQAYTTLTLADTRAIYSPTKRGNIVQITRETIVNDDLYAIKQIPQKLAVAAAYTLAEFVYNLLAPSFGNIYDGHPLYDSINHGNTGIAAASLGTAAGGSALNSADLQTAVVKMRKQTNLAGKPIGLKPRYLLTVPDLEFQAMTLLKSAGLPGGNNNDINPSVKGVRGRPLAFVFSGKSRGSAAVVRLHSPLFAATVAKTVATGDLSVRSRLILYPATLVPLNMEWSRERTVGAPQKLGGRAHLKRIVTEAGKGVVESLQEFVILIAAEAAKRAIWG